MNVRLEHGGAIPHEWCDCTVKPKNIKLKKNRRLRQYQPLYCESLTKLRGDTSRVCRKINRISNCSRTHWRALSPPGECAGRCDGHTGRIRGTRWPCLLAAVSSACFLLRGSSSEQGGANTYGRVCLQNVRIEFACNEEGEASAWPARDVEGAAAG